MEGVKQIHCFKQQLPVGAFSAKAQGINAVKAVKQPHTALSKILRAGTRIDIRQLKNQIRPGMKRFFSAFVHRKNSRFSALDKVTAHQGDQIVSACLAARFTDKKAMPFMQGIQFTDKGSDLHVSECFVCMFTYGISIAHQLTKAQNISMIKFKILCGFSCLNPRKKEVV